jgi:hypothetical protein
MSKDTNPPGPPDSNNSGGKIITFPSGERVNTNDVGINSVIGQVGNVHTPEIMDPISVADEVRDRIKYVKKQEIVKALKDNSSTAVTIDALLLEIAEELSHLKFERRKASQEGKNTSNYTVSRINSLRSMAELLLKRKEAALAEKLDLKSPRLQKIFEVWMEFFYESMIKCQIPDHLTDLVFQQMKADMVEWEKRIEAM